MNQASIRTEKLHSNDLSKVKNHNQRINMEDSLIVDKERTPDNVILHEKHEGLDIDQAVRHDISQRVGGNKVRKDAVVAREVVISASPEYFFPEMTDRKVKDRGPLDQDKLEAWKDVNMKLLKEKYDKNLIRVDLHLDESTPHLHAIVVPIVEKTLHKRRTKAQIENGEEGETYIKSRLDDKTLSHPTGQYSYKSLQDDLGGDERLKALGIERGTEHSRATHMELDEYHTALMQDQKKIKKLEPYEVPETPMREQMITKKKVVDTDKLIKVVEDQANEINKLRKRNNRIADSYNKVVGAKNMALVKLESKEQQIEAYTELQASPQELAEQKLQMLEEGYRDGKLKASNELAKKEEAIADKEQHLQKLADGLVDVKQNLEQRERMVELKSNMVKETLDTANENINNIERLAQKKGLSDRELQAAASTARKNLNKSKNMEQSAELTLGE